MFCWWMLHMVSSAVSFYRLQASCAVWMAVSRVAFLCEDSSLLMLSYVKVDAMLEVADVSKIRYETEYWKNTV